MPCLRALPCPGAKSWGKLLGGLSPQHERGAIEYDDVAPSRPPSLLALHGINAPMLWLPRLGTSHEVFVASTRCAQISADHRSMYNPSMRYGAVRDWLRCSETRQTKCCKKLDRNVGTIPKHYCSHQGALNGGSNRVHWIYL
jgi:hypothetical protein